MPAIEIRAALPAMAELACDPYILQQASCRASLLVATCGFSRDDWDDLRQEMVLDCLERLPWFDPVRGDWRAFVRGVVRHQSAVLASRESRRLRFEALAAVDEESDGENAFDRDTFRPACEPASEDPTAALTLSTDVQRLVASLPHHLRTLATDLSEMSVAEIAAKRNKSRQWIYQLVVRLRKAFLDADVMPESVRFRGGVQ
jgi:RNA polymerase sigma-70 factor (ECF subfamily)